MLIATATLTFFAAMPVMPQAQKVPQYVKMRTRVLYRVPLPASRVVAWYAKILRRPAKQGRAGGSQYTVIARRESVLRIPGNPIPLYSEAAVVWQVQGGGSLLLLIDEPGGGVQAKSLKMYGNIPKSALPRSAPLPLPGDEKTFGRPPEEAQFP
jgi:hypothetical protein